MSTDSLKLDRDGYVTTLTLNRESARNALNVEMLDALPGLLREIANDPEVRCLVITGSGKKAFCAGGDISGVEADDNQRQFSGDALIAKNIAWCESAFIIHSMPKPVVASLNGVAAGAGFSLTLACDLRIASDTSAMTTAFAKVGMPGDYGGSYFLPQIVGSAKARELYFLSEKLSAENALDIGLLNWVVPSDTLQEETHKLAQRLAGGPPLAYGQMKENLNRAFLLQADEAISLEAEAMIKLSSTEDAKEAVMAFFEKRQANFKGR